MLKLIADSGSTKTDWVLISDGVPNERYTTEGLNPYFSTKAQIEQVIREELKIKMDDQPIDEIHFYGSGCAGEANKQILKKALAGNFNGSRIEIRSDLLAAAHACLGNEAGVVCILGTGSNACLYDGQKIIKQIPSLGFSLGDEGSGGYLGRMILNSYFYERMPEDLRKFLQEKENMDLHHILEKVYKQANANRYVASFVEILSEHAGHPFVQQLVRKNFEDFADHQLSYFGDLKGQELGFVGSLAAHYQNILEEVIHARSMKVRTVLSNPTDKLVEYHLQAGS